MAGYFRVFKFSQFSRIYLKPWKSALKIWESGLFPLSTLYCRSFEPIHEIKSMKWVICEHFSAEVTSYNIMVVQKKYYWQQLELNPSYNLRTVVDSYTTKPPAYRYM